MKIYLVIVEDTHSDVDVVPFYSKDEAINYAKETAEKYCSSLFDLEEKNIEGWIFFCQYTPESFLHVIEEEIR